jgi:hypothetical protein
MSLWGVARHYKGYMVATAHGSCYTHWNREELVEKALAADCTHLWFVDTDVTFPHDTLDRLLAHRVGVVGAYYPVRQQDQSYSTLKIDDNGVLKPLLPPLPDRTFSQVRGKPLAAIPTGMMLIDLDVLSNIKPPYFRCERPVGEDIFFCTHLYAAGVTLWCDPTIPVGHVGEMIY